MEAHSVPLRRLFGRFRKTVREFMVWPRCQMQTDRGDRNGLAMGVKEELCHHQHKLAWQDLPRTVMPRGSTRAVQTGYAALWALTDGAEAVSIAIGAVHVQLLLGPPLAEARHASWIRPSAVNGAARQPAGAHVEDGHCCL